MSQSSPPRMIEMKGSLRMTRSVDTSKAKRKEATIADHYVLGRRLGCGCSGTVYEATVRGTGQTVAIKRIKKNVSERLDQLARREVQIIADASTVDSESIAKCFASVDDPEYIHIIMEKVGGGELLKHIMDVGEYSEPDAQKAFRGLIPALRSLHARGIIHRDIKPDNVLLVEGDHTQVKLIDFGLANVHSGDEGGLVSKCGTR